MWFMGARYGLFTVPKSITVCFPKSSVVIYPVLSPSSTVRGGMWWNECYIELVGLQGAALWKTLPRRMHAVFPERSGHPPSNQEPIWAYGEWKYAQRDLNFLEFFSQKS